MSLDNVIVRFLNKAVPRRFQLVIYILLLALPVAYVIRQFDSRMYFTSLICFGPAFKASALPEIRSLPIEFVGKRGYDGQFYAQIAISPSLRNPGLAKALDLPEYRARRILLPALAYVLGFGRPGLILEKYALLNLAFFAGLLVALHLFLKPVTVRQFLCVVAILWTTGGLISIQRALTDLPAAALCFVAASVSGFRAFPVFAAAVLTREASLLSLPSVIWLKKGEGRIWQTGAGLLVVIVPFLAWLYYVQRIFPGHSSSPWYLFNVPLMAWWGHLKSAVVAFRADQSLTRTFEVIAPVSLLVQAVYFLVRPGPTSPYWRMGIGFAVLFFFLGTDIFVEQPGYCRILLPLTLAFNVLLLKREDRFFAPWFILGNAGLAGGCVQMFKVVF